MAAPTDEPHANCQEPEHPGHASLYSHIGLFPELGRFRRFAAEWAKLLHDDTEEIRLYQGKVAAELKTASLPPSGMSVCDIPRSVVKDNYPDIFNNSWKPYEQALRQYGSDFCRSQQMVTQAGQAAYATKYLSQFTEPIFENGKFSLTDENECFYLGPSETHDSCAWGIAAPQDFLAERIFAMILWIKRHVFRRSRRPNDRRKARKSACKCRDAEYDPPYIRYHILVEVVDVLTCIFISLLLTSAIFALKSIKTRDARGGVIGALGTVFSISVKFLAGGPSRRIEVYAATAAFFAVASVFVSSSDY